MKKDILSNKDSINRILSQLNKDIYWSLESDTGDFFCTIEPNGQLEIFTENKFIQDTIRSNLINATYNFAQNFINTTKKNEWHLPEPMVLEISASTKKGETHTIFGEISVSHLSDDNGQSIGLVGITKDISKQKRLESTLQKSEAIYRTLIKTSPDAIVIFDNDGDIIKSNNQAAFLAKQDRNEMIGNSYKNYVPKDQNNTLEKIKDELRENGISNTQEFLFSRSDGSTFFGEISISLMDENNDNIDAYIAVIRDITKRKKAENEIKKSSERYQHLIETMNEGLIIIDKNGLFTYINQSASEIFEYSFEELLGQPITSILDKKNQKKLEKHVQKAGKDSKIKIRFELQIKTKSKNNIYTVMSLNNIYGNQGDFHGSYAVVTDITKEKIAEAERKKLEAELIGLLFNRLSEREIELLHYLVKGNTWPEQKREIAKAMDVLPGTLDKFMARIKTKIEINEIEKILTIASRYLK